MSGSLIFAIYLTIFALGLGYAAWLTRKWIADASDYILGGREISLLINVFGVAAIGFAGTSIAMGPAFAITHGYWASLLFGVMYAFGGLALYGILFTNFVRRCGAQTLPEWLEVRYSGSVREVVTITTVLGLAGIMANNVASLANVLTGYTGWPLWVTITASFLLILLFSYFSGLWAVTLTDFLQVIIGMIAIPLLFILLIAKFGGLGWLNSSWPGPNMWTAGFTGAKLPLLSLKYPSLFTFALLYAAFLVWGNNYYWLRAASCRSERAARLSYVWAAVLLFFVFYIPLGFIGQYAATIYPKLFAPVGKVAPASAFGVVLQEFPAALSSFFLIGVVAASVSTGATALIGATSTAIRDIYQRIFRPKATPQELLKPSKVFLLLLGVFTWVLSYYPGGPVYLFAFANAWLGPPAWLVLLGILWRRTSPAGAFWGTLMGMIVMVIFTLLDLMKIYSISNLMHLGVVGSIVTLGFAVLISLLTAPKYYGRRDWAVDPALGKREEVVLKPEDLRVLELIRYGHESMAEITDALKVDSRHANEYIERLDRGGYIKRRSLIGSGFYVFELTEKGRAALPQLTQREDEMARLGLKAEYVELLAFAAEKPNELPLFAQKKNLASLEVSSIIALLVRKGYLAEGGLWKRTVRVTEKGKEVLAKWAAQQAS